MKIFLRYIAVIDKQEKLHHVALTSGLNIITGASSTGKSAILEIFDYCMGSSEDTIPVGIITERAKAFLIAFEFESYILVAARLAQSSSCFLSEHVGQSHEAVFERMKAQPSQFITRRNFFPIDDFKKSLGRHFGVTLENIDTDPYRQIFGRKKSATPSIRSFSSFMLQHQNLVANKHAIFYRFEEKEKRDQAIDHFKILMGLVGEDYFDKVKELELAQAELKKISNQIPRQAKRKSDFISRYEFLLLEYHTFAGEKLIEASPQDIYAKPETYLAEVTGRTVKIDALSDLVQIRRNQLLEERSQNLVKKREAQGRLVQVESSIKSALDFGSTMTQAVVPKSAQLGHHECPVCESQTTTQSDEASKLIDAIEWLNSELRVSKYALESFANQRRIIQGEILETNKTLTRIQKELQPLDEEVARLKTSKSASEQATKAKVKLELAIQDQLSKPVLELSKDELKWQNEVNRLQGLVNAYGVQSKLNQLSEDINTKMCELGDRFDFEKTYKPSKLKFDTQTFDLWYQRDPKTRVYLRSMGSGANWLYSHLALFMSLHYQFASHTECKIPPILFLDQPTQVYFPALDIDKKFDSGKSSERANRSKNQDADLKSVNNIFTQLAYFCEETLKATGVEPQIIVSDHADGLTLGKDYQFSSFVRATWRDRGLIEEVKDSSTR
ncbi:DUF3732 domain-containing protein [Pseudomonas faucium]|uniref:DUF3732 domain-containing protein n=1 Tax=Pseudomonas faucium TaxID=2740518 RepID=UPI00159671A6|nr:DUF3732 domain-containing protein [Pseudomonas faucium]